MILTSRQAQASEQASGYMQSWKKDKQKAIQYLQSRQKISSQQRMLHELINKDFLDVSDVFLADFGCGGGWSSYHLHKELGINKFSLFDLCSFALELAEDNLRLLNLSDLKFIHDDIAKPRNLPENFFDIAISMMTLCCIDNQADFLKNMLGSLKKGGVLYVSTLYNRWHHGVDLEILQKDKARNGSYRYKVLCKDTLANILSELDQDFKLAIYDFNIDTDLSKPLDGGIGTYTIPANGDLLEISGGALFQWSFLKFTKSS